MKNKKSTIIFIIVLVVIIVALGIFYFITHRSSGGSTEEADVTATQVQTVLNRDLSINYPPSPKEVVKYYSDITECFYNESYTDDELYDLAMQIRALYDDELVATQTEDEYLTQLKSDIADMKDKKCTISSYSVSASTDVQYDTLENGDERAMLYCTYTLLQGTDKFSTTELFVLRQDADKHWKILGWQLASNE